MAEDEEDFEAELARQLAALGPISEEELLQEEQAEQDSLAALLARVGLEDEDDVKGLGNDGQSDEEEEEFDYEEMVRVLQSRNIDIRVIGVDQTDAGLLVLDEDGQEEQREWTELQEQIQRRAAVAQEASREVDELQGATVTELAGVAAISRDTTRGTESGTEKQATHASSSSRSTQSEETGAQLRVDAGEGEKDEEEEMEVDVGRLQRLEEASRQREQALAEENARLEEMRKKRQRKLEIAQRNTERDMEREEARLRAQLRRQEAEAEALARAAAEDEAEASKEQVYAFSEEQEAEQRLERQLERMQRADTMERMAREEQYGREVQEAQRNLAMAARAGMEAEEQYARKVERAWKRASHMERRAMLLEDMYMHEVMLMAEDERHRLRAEEEYTRRVRKAQQEQEARRERHARERMAAEERYLRRVRTFKLHEAQQEEMRKREEARQLAEAQRKEEQRQRELLAKKLREQQEAKRRKEEAERLAALAREQEEARKREEADRAARARMQKLEAQAMAHAERVAMQRAFGGWRSWVAQEKALRARMGPMQFKFRPGTRIVPGEGGKPPVAPKEDASKGASQRTELMDGLNAWRRRHRDGKHRRGVGSGGTGFTPPRMPSTQETRASVHGNAENMGKRLHATGKREGEISEALLSLHAGAGAIADLVSLDLKQEGIKHLTELHRCAGLKHLNVNVNELQDLSGLDCLRDLRTLMARDNKLAHMGGLQRNRELRMVNLAINEITEMGGLDECVQLRELVLESNRLERIQGLEACVHLQRLLLYRNGIRRLEGLQTLRQLQKLDVGRNNLETIEGLEGCPLLHTLILYNNNIQELPAQWDNPMLERLFLQGNAVTALPRLQGLPKLVYLDVSDNRLTQVAGLDSTPMLTWLNLSFNELQRLEDVGGLAKLMRLVNVQLNDNPLSNADNYRLECIAALPAQVRDLDNHVIGADERVRAENSAWSLPEHRMRVRRGVRQLAMAAPWLVEQLDTEAELPPHALEQMENAMDPSHREGRVVDGSVHGKHWRRIPGLVRGMHEREVNGAEATVLCTVARQLEASAMFATQRAAVWRQIKSSGASSVEQQSRMQEAWDDQQVQLAENQLAELKALDDGVAAMGRAKVVRHGHYAFLHARLRRVRSCVCLQRWWKRVYARRQAARQGVNEAAALAIQSVWRGAQVRRRHALAAQLSAWRSQRAFAATQIQATYRGWRVRATLQRVRQSTRALDLDLGLDDDEFGMDMDMDAFLSGTSMHFDESEGLDLHTQMFVPPTPEPERQAWQAHDRNETANDVSGMGGGVAGAGVHAVRALQQQQQQQQQQQIQDDPYASFRAQYEQAYGRQGQGGEGMLSKEYPAGLEAQMRAQMLRQERAQQEALLEEEARQAQARQAQKENQRMEAQREEARVQRRDSGGGSGGASSSSPKKGKAQARREEAEDSEASQIAKEWGFSDSRIAEMMIKRRNKFQRAKKKKTVTAEERYRRFQHNAGVSGTSKRLKGSVPPRGGGGSSARKGSGSSGNGSVTGSSRRGRGSSRKQGASVPRIRLELGASSLNGGGYDGYGYSLDQSELSDVSAYSLRDPSPRQRLMEEYARDVDVMRNNLVMEDSASVHSEAESVYSRASSQWSYEQGAVVSTPMLPPIRGASGGQGSGMGMGVVGSSSSSSSGYRAGSGGSSSSSSSSYANGRRSTGSRSSSSSSSRSSVTYKGPRQGW